MSEEFIHLSVLGSEAPEALVADPDGLYVDGTFGRGGHSRRILAKLSEKGRLIAFDRDPEAVKAAALIDDPRFRIIHEPFSTMRESLAALGITAVDGIFLDIGVSSPQIDDASRGFSFRFDGPLDMRMDTTRGMTAAEWLACADERDIRHVISLYGEERFAGPIARAIVERRKTAPLATTRELADLVARVVPRVIGQREGGRFQKRVQCFRQSAKAREARVFHQHRHAPVRGARHPFPEREQRRAVFLPVFVKQIDLSPRQLEMHALGHVQVHAWHAAFRRQPDGVFRRS